MARTRRVVQVQPATRSSSNVHLVSGSGLQLDEALRVTAGKDRHTTAISLGGNGTHNPICRLPSSDISVVVNAASARGRLTKIAHSLRVSALVFVSLTRAPGGTRHRSNLSSVWSNRAVGYCSNPPANLNESQKFFIAITGKGFMQPKIVCGEFHGKAERPYNRRHYHPSL